MPSLSAHRGASVSTDDLIVWNRHGKDVVEYLDVIYKEVEHRFVELKDKFSDYDEHSGSIIIEMNALYAQANDVAADYSNLFDIYMCLHARHVHAEGRYRYKAYECIQAAFALLALELGAEPGRDIESVALGAWRGILVL